MRACWLGRSSAETNRVSRYLQLLVKFQQSLLVLAFAPEQVEINRCAHEAHGAVVSREIAAGWLVQRFMDELPQLRLDIRPMSMHPAMIVKLSSKHQTSERQSSGRRPDCACEPRTSGRRSAFAAAAAAAAATARE